MIELPPAWRSRAIVLAGPADRSLFTNEELATADAFKLPKRRNEWLLSREAAKRLGTRNYVSYSHSGDYAGAATDDEPVGLDVQVIRDIDERVSHLFLTDAETAAMQRCSLPHRVLHFWCAKEAAWKPRSSRYATLKQLPLVLIEERANGLLFDLAETIAIADVIIALSGVRQR